MTVTLPRPESASADLIDDATRWSIRLAVAQWLRSPRGVAAARERLRSLGVEPAEIERRRRAESADASLTGVLRLAVTTVFSRGALTAADRRRLDGRADVALPVVVDAALAAYTEIVRADALATAPAPALDLNVGDY